MMANPYNNWTNSTGYGSYPSNTGTAATVSNSQYYTSSTYWQQQTYTVPMPLDKETVRRHEEMLRRRAPLDKWLKSNEKRISERRKKEEAEASELAKRLLLEYIDEKNRKNFEEEKPLEVESGIYPDVKYQIPNYDGRIKAWKGDKVVSELCLMVKAPEWIPDEDKLLAKLLYLQNDEAHALRTANHFNITENLLEGLNG